VKKASAFLKKKADVQPVKQLVFHLPYQIQQIYLKTFR